MPLDPQPVIAVDDLQVDLDGRGVLHDITLHIGAGELVTILGRNGSGKSTLIRTMLDLIPAREGQVTLFGIPAHQFAERDRVGYVPQRSATASDVPATVYEVVEMGLLARRRLFARRRSGHRPAIAAALSKVGMLALRDRSISQLSGGQHQRVLIARAIVNNPELLILDEPTAGVDRENTEALAHILAELNAAGTTIVVVAHDLGPLRPYVTRALIIDEGRIRYDGSVAGLVDEGDHPHHDHDAESIPRPLLIDAEHPHIVPPEGVW